MKMQHVIEVKNVSKVIKGQTLIDEVSLAADKGKIIGLTGRNGSGKTVLLKLICGLFVPTEGTVYVEGKRVGKDVDFPGNTGILIETPGFLPNMSGFRNLKLLAAIRHKINDEKIREAIRAVGLDPEDKKPVGKYSLGMRQRLGLAQAVMEDPDVLLLDEPFNGIDRNGINELRGFIFGQKEKGSTVLITSHSMDDIAFLCDDVYSMEMGRLSKGNYLSEEIK